ncbi:C-factor-like isoform X2 [Microplitis mediator]|uniref:C-factor-like isoform X1 n=1 Tax=Microplitis mediator TaxID=375433 RepID=UPI0025544B58|nr:C-factor-like isoform X1 [Microplitis mediator]XP_057321603.1 C-factor-like isoform X2 [Microplitis mediator]
MRSILITGCNRGLGLGLVQHLTQLPNPPEKIFATCRDINKAEKLREIAERSKNVHIIKADLKDLKDYERIVNEVSSHVGDAGLNVLFNNAAIMTQSTKLEGVKAEDLTEVYFVNTVVPIMLTKAFLPLLKKAAAGKQGMGVDRAAVINMTSLMGSIADNGSGGAYPYRCSKAALNAATKSMSVDLKDDGILVACMHPGWVKTDMGGGNAPMDVDSSVQNMIQTVLGLSEKDNGTFIRHNGTILPW